MRDSDVPTMWKYLDYLDVFVYIQAVFYIRL